MDFANIRNDTSPMTEAAAQAVGHLVRTAREGHNMSVREAARQAGISEGRWRQIESGEQKVGGGATIPVRPRPSTLRRVAQAVGADVAALFNAAGMEPATDERAAAEPSPADTRAAIVADRRLSPEARAVLLASYDALAQEFGEATAETRARLQQERRASVVTESTPRRAAR